MGRRIVFINQATGYLTIDIINEFAKVFKEVALITGSIRVQDTPLVSNVKVSYIIKYNRGNSLRKGTSWLIGTIQIIFLLMFRYQGYERFYFTIPPLTPLFAPLFRSRYAIAVYDLYPDALKIHEYDVKGLLYRWWSARNRKAFGKAHIVIALSENMRKGILTYSPEAKVYVVPNWTAFTGYSPVPKERNAIIEREGLNNKFIVQYSGNIGATHNVETVVELAALFSGRDDIEFQIIGRGDRTASVAATITEHGLVNCRLQEFRRDEELFESLCSANIAVITLDQRIKDASVPSKVYNLMAAGIPLLAVTSEGTALAGIVRDYSLGGVFDMTDLQGMKAFVNELMKDNTKRSFYAANALKASADFTARNASLYLKHYLD